MKNLLSLLIFLSLAANTSNNKESHLYSTWDTMEVDKCASAWLIKRFIDKEAEFKFFPSGELITEGIPFDTPDSEFRRYHNMSTFESILKKYKIKDSSLIYIGKIMHDIEINFWGKKVIKETEEVEKEVRKIIDNSKDGHECFRRSFIYFDNLYNKLKKPSETPKESSSKIKD